MSKPDAKPVSPWIRDQRAFDPGAIVRTVEVDGRLFTVHNVLGPGWPMSVRSTAVASQHVGMAGWENWSEVAAAARS